MAKGAMSVAKGVAFGMIAGAAASMVGKKMMAKNKMSLKKKTGRALKEMSSIMDSASYMFK